MGDRNVQRAQFRLEIPGLVRLLAGTFGNLPDNRTETGTTASRMITPIARFVICSQNVQFSPAMIDTSSSSETTDT